MKNLTLLLVLPVSGIFACQQVKPPKEVSDAFTAKFTAVEKVQWEQEEENIWEAEFMLNGKEMSACFDNTGNWLETEIAMKIEELPQAVTDSLKVKLEGYEIEEAESLEKSDFKGFEVVMEKEDEELEILITADGEIISKNVVEEDEDEGEGKEEDEEEGEDEGEEEEDED